MKKIVLFLFICFDLLAQSQPAKLARFDSLFDLLNAKQKAMGSLALRKNGMLIYKRSVGYCDISEQEKKSCSDYTKYRVGSITKMFTATMIMQLVEENKLHLSDYLSSYFPQVPNAEKITIEQMLNHHSGIHSFTDDSTYTSWLHEPKSKEQLLTLIVNGKPEFEPGTKGAYSNSNYLLLGYIIEKISGKSYVANLKSRITKPLNITSTYYGGKTSIKNNEGYSYQYTDKWVKDTETDMSIPGGAGAIVSTPIELTTFIEALFQGKLISQKSVSQMMSIKDGYGLGLFQFPFYKFKAYGHSGGIDGFHNNLAYFPHDSLSIAYCSNGEVYPMNDIMLGVLSIYYNRPYSMPVFSDYKLKEEDLDKYIGVYASKELPIKITVTKKGNALICQVTGQPSFPLEPTAEHQFKFEKAGVVMEFDPQKNEMTLKQAGGVYLFKKE